MSLCVVDGLHCRCQPPEVPCDGVVKLNAEIERLTKEIAALRDRLEMHYTDGKGNRVEFDEPSMDGISCRDETIKLQDNRIRRMTRYETAMIAEIAAKDATISAAVRGESIACDALRQRIAEKDAEIAALKALGTKFLLTIEALENDVNEETEQAWIDAYDAMKALLAKEPTAPQATGEKEQTP